MSPFVEPSDAREVRARELALLRWERAGLVATMVLLLVVPLAFVKFCLRVRPAPALTAATYVGRESCRECHRDAFDRWTGSDHALAMQAANDSTVLGDFDDATFDYFGVVSRFYRKGGKYWVRTQGPAGVMADYEIAYTFGVRPLQQYLIAFPGGRFQCLTIAWDAVRKRWYHLYPNAYAPPDDWLHWTRGAMNWNGMCAQCHSTNVQKNYDPDTDTYRTTWSEMEVSCEACHGPCSKHLEWARLPAMARPESDDYGLVISTRGMSAREQVELCAQCHARRSLLEAYRHDPGTDLLDHMVPTLLDEHIYFPDGQIQDEDYEYGSFVQSKMYRNGVRCTDCHDPHTGRRRAEGNVLCVRCHQQDVYDTGAHHFHKQEVDGLPSAGWLCSSCHMPQRVYMGIDWRADHSLRVPRPDLSPELSTPSACSQAGCHADKPLKWAADAFAKWYGVARRPHYGQIVAAARAGQPRAHDELLRLAQDRLYPPIVRATAVSLLDRAPAAVAGTSPDTQTQQVVARALDDEESLVRRAALERVQLLPAPERLRRLAPLLRDPVKAVRINAAAALADLADRSLAPADSTSFADALAEYVEWLRYQLDFASSGYNLGNLYTALQRPVDAERAYRAALRIDPLFVQTRVNYAMLLSSLGRNPEAEAQLREAVKAAPGLAQAWYNLGLLLGEMGRMPEGVAALERSAALAPDFARAHYNLGLAYREVGRLDAADHALRRALKLEPASADYLFALADLELRRGRRGDARRFAQTWLDLHPDDPRARQMVEAITAGGL